MTVPHTRPPRPATGRRWSLGLSVAVLVVIVLVGGAVLLLRPGDGNDAPTSPPGAAPTGGASPSSQGAVPQPLPTEIPTAAPRGLTWRLLGQIPLPYSDTDGPRQVTDTTATGYTRSPMGALLAAAQIIGRSGLSAGREIYEPTLREQFVPSDDRDRLLQGLLGAPQQPAENGELAQPAGFIYQSYTPDTAVIALVQRAPSAQSNPVYFALTVTMRWLEEDWRMVAPPSGVWTSLSRQVTDLTGVVEWER